MDTTIMTGNRSFIDDNKTYETATVDLAIRNGPGPIKHQAVALRVEANLGYQDTLYVKRQRQFYRDCKIYGTIDFICGDATTLLQNCLIVARFPLFKQYNTITAQQREHEDSTTVIVLQNCSIKTSQHLSNVTTYFGRPWGDSFG
uniref:Pectinesterase catalytic domain-containing protein n=1 Tax=Solanum lycopersicum TaxID=4081 RepID=A0A3Q7IYV1_SOLLC